MSLGAAYESSEIERFAALCARLDSGLAQRDLVLALAGVDEGAYQELCRRLLPLLASNGSSAGPAVHFARCYARAREEIARLRGGDSQVENTDEPSDTDRDPARDLQTIDEADQTMVLQAVQLGSALPFKPASTKPCRADDTDATLEVPCAAPAAVLPFVAPAPTGRRQRLHRFDAQTGQPLASPIWVDEPESAPSRP